MCVICIQERIGGGEGEGKPLMDDTVHPSHKAMYAHMLLIV
jgi:hypothetical protein